MAEATFVGEILVGCWILKTRRETPANLLTGETTAMHEPANRVAVIVTRRDRVSSLIKCNQVRVAESGRKCGLKCRAHCDQRGKAKGRVGPAKLIG